MATLNIKKWDDYYATDKAAKKQTVSAGYDSQLQTADDYYNAQIKETESDYTDQYRENAVQKLINEREVAESMANLGLTDSGLNRTQQTAVQLSYANNKAKIDRQKQSMVDSLKLQLSANVSEIQTNKSNALMAIDEDYANRAASAAQSEYETALKYETELEKARIEAAQKAAEAANSRVLYTYARYDSDKEANAYEGTDGKTHYFAEGINPYTGDNNTLYVPAGAEKGTGVLSKGTDAQKAAYTYGVYSNGYQPKGVYSNGINYGNTQNTGFAKLETEGEKPRTIWYTDTRYGVHYWVWSGFENRYVEIVALGRDENGNTQWGKVQ